ncbi:MAG: FAD-binding oxidoreductase [SAR324 cluster bacterium]|nr:FAD-binding oxidoreductase [SAR324 cluster bacterium]
MAASAGNQKEFDVVIIGGGIIGCATAYFLAKRGMSVKLLEKGRLAWEQSSRNWGFVRMQNRSPFEIPIAVLGHRLWRELSPELGAETDWVEGGGLSLARTEPEMEPFETACRVAAEHGIDTRIVSRQEIRRLIPAMEGEFAGGLYTASDGMAHPLKATLALAGAARRKGAEIEEYCAVEGFLTEGKRVAGVRTEKEEVLGKTILCAAGIYSRKLARMLGINLPIRGVRESVAATAPMAPLSNLTVFGKEVCFRQTTDGCIYLSCTNLGSADFDVTLEAFRNIPYFLPTFLKYRDMLRIHVGKPLWDDILRAMPWSQARKRPFAHAVDLEPEINDRTIEACRQAFMAHFPSLGEVKIERTWAGIIDSTPDLLPVLGPVAGSECFWFATGHSGHGFGIGPPVGYLMAEWIAEGKPSIDLHPLRFERFAEGDFMRPGPIG